MLITVGSVDSIRNLPATALMGDTIVMGFALALCCFLLPVTVVVAWFARQSVEGVYGWVKTGLGARSGFQAVWFQWMQNILVYPTLLSFIAGLILYTINPQLAENPRYLFVMINVLIWTLTWINLKGIYLSARFNAVCTLAGLVLPFLLIIGAGLFGFLTDNQPHVAQSTGFHEGMSLTAIILSLCGMEIAGVHGRESKNGAFVKALFLSVIIIVVSSLFGALTIHRFIPAEQLSLVNGIPQFIELVLTRIHYPQYAAFFNILVVLGCVGCANNWLIAPVKGLMFASETSASQTGLLLVQAGCVSLLSTLFLFFPEVNASYWLMLILATQMYLFMYVMMFASAIRLQWLSGQYRMLLFSVSGLTTVLVLIATGFQAPAQISVHSQWMYGWVTALILISLSWASCGFNAWFRSPFAANLSHKDRV